MPHDPHYARKAIGDLAPHRLGDADEDGIDDDGRGLCRQRLGGGQAGPGGHHAQQRGGREQMATHTRRTPPPVRVRRAKGERKQSVTNGAARYTHDGPANR